MHGISYAALMLTIDGLPESKSGDGKKGKKKAKLSTDINTILAQARAAKQG